MEDVETLAGVRNIVLDKVEDMAEDHKHWKDNTTQGEFLFLGAGHSND